MKEPFLEARGIGKSFPGVRALAGVDLHVRAGEVVALVGENGAGKSTLMKILAGVQSADAGELRVGGRVRVFRQVREAQEAGIGLIHQELNLAENLSVMENLFLGRERHRGGFLKKAEMRREAARFLKMVGLEEEPDSVVGGLKTGKRQLVEIAKALAMEARLLIMDEPTSSLSLAESERLFRVIRELRERGVAVIYISHRLGEVRALADRVVVLRDGENAGELAGAEITHEKMVGLMVGREVAQHYQRQRHDLGEVALRVRDLRTRSFPQEKVSFELRAGEIVGVAGLVGAGRSEMLEALFGVAERLSGEIEVAGESLAGGSGPRAAMAAGLALVPEDRKGQGLVLEMGVAENLSLPTLSRRARGGFWVNEKAEGALAESAIAGLGIKTPEADCPARFLSGGNQQKIVIGKWLESAPRVLLLDEPTRGIDIGAKEEIYGLIERLAAGGMAVLFVSSELEEVMGLADRVLVMREGRLSGELAAGEWSEERIMALATTDQAGGF
ncbi:MAG: sugar ABC transporter ATP-binding protein [Verrucomicrobiales bacterium]